MVYDVGARHVVPHSYQLKGKILEIYVLNTSFSLMTMIDSYFPENGITNKLSFQRRLESSQVSLVIWL